MASEYSFVQYLEMALSLFLKKGHFQKGQNEHTQYNRALRINNKYRLCQIEYGYIDYFLIRIKDLFRLIGTQHPNINPPKSV